MGAVYQLIVRKARYEVSTHSIGETSYTTFCRAAVAPMSGAAFSLELMTVATMSGNGTRWLVQDGLCCAISQLDVVKTEEEPLTG